MVKYIGMVMTQPYRLLVRDEVDVVAFVGKNFA
jgi:hypothetical protein